MTPSFRPDAPITPDVLGQLEAADERFLFDFFREHAEEPLLDAWLLSRLQPPTARGQTLLRLARQAFSYWEGLDGRQHLLFGIPVVVQDVSATQEWTTLEAELRASLISALLPLSADVALCRQPLPVGVLHNIGATHLGEWSEHLFSGRDPAQGLYEPGTTGAHVWVGQVSVPQLQRLDLEALLFTMNKAWSSRVRQLLVRMEGLAEDRGVRMRLFQPIAMWNSLSMARLFHARMQLEPFRKQAGPWQVVREASEVVLCKDGRDALRLNFPEELGSDIAPLFAGWSEFRV